MLAAMLAALLGAATPASAGDAAEFHFVKSSWRAPAIPGPPFGVGERQGNARRAIDRTWLNDGGGGEIRGLLVAGGTADERQHGVCNLVDRVVYATLNNSDFCSLEGSDSRTMIDLRLVPHRPVGTPPRFGSIGAGVGGLDGDRGQIRAALRKVVASSSRQQPVASRAALKFQAAANILENPLASRSTRRAVRALLVSEPKVDSTGLSRERTRLSIADRSHAGEMTFGDGSGNYVTHDLSDKVEFRQELVLDSDNYPTVERTVLLDSKFDELQEWLADQGGPTAVYTTTFSRPRIVREPKYAQRRVSCKSIDVESDGVCIEVGGPGGRKIVTGG